MVEALGADWEDIGPLRLKEGQSDATENAGGSLITSDKDALK